MIEPLLLPPEEEGQSICPEAGAGHVLAKKKKKMQCGDKEEAAGKEGLSG